MVKFVSKDHFEAAVLYKLYLEANGAGNQKAPFEVASLFDVEVPQRRVALALEALEGDRRLDAFKGNFTFYRMNNWGLVMAEAQLSDKRSFMYQLSINGDAWAFGEAMAPASDRLVSFSHNDPSVEQIVTSLNQIELEISQNNSVAIALGESRDVALTEVGVLRALLDKDRVRAKLFLETARRTLSWVAEKAAGTSVTEIAKIALKQIIDWLT